MRRKLNGIEIHQNHKTGMINVTELVKNFNRVSGLMNGVDNGIPNHRNSGDLEVLENSEDSNSFNLNELEFPEKQLNNYWKSQPTKDFIASLARSEDCAPKDLTVSKRGKYGGTWAHPLIFVDICMWLSPDFKVAALKIVYDHLLELRDQSGDEYKALCRAMSDKKMITHKWDYARVANEITDDILGDTTSGAWDNATEKQLHDRYDVETFITNAINAGFIKDLNTVIKTIKKHCKDLG